MPVIRILTILAGIALLAPAAASALTPQQERMKSCSSQASDKDLKGDKRADFMSECLRADKSDRNRAATGGTRSSR